MDRRKFLQTSSATGAALMLSRISSRAQSTSRTPTIEVLIHEPIGTIAPEIYGHFTENLGAVIYDGVWVGEGSRIPNVHGIRKALIEELRQIKAPVIRWPGGCFADSYDWRDGIGPRDKRPTRTNFWSDAQYAKKLNGKGPQLYDPNAFGTDEFVRFCKLSGAEPYLAANLRSLPAMEFDRWIEYCNSPPGSTTLANQRSAAGSAKAYGVKYWGVGNESWGCGGGFEPEDYASEFRRFTSWVPGYGVDLKFVGSGPNGDETYWTQRFFKKLFESKSYFDLKTIWGWSVHHYAWNLSRGRTSDFNAGKGDSLQYDLVDYYETLREADRIEGILLEQWAALGEYDHAHRIKLVVDEYGPWYKPSTELDPTHLLGQQITMRDALVTALSLDTFNRHADKVGMAACAQLINCLNALFFAHEDKFIVTPNFHVFDMYSAHQGAMAVCCKFSAPDVHYMRDGKAASFWGLKGSASLKGKLLTLTVVNADAANTQEAELSVPGSTFSTVSAKVLSSPDMHAHNTFLEPDAVLPSTQTVRVKDDRAVFQFPAASVTVLTFSLG